MPDNPVYQQLPFPVRVIRWWASVAIWLQAWSVISEGWLPVLLLIDPETLGFSPKAAAVVMLSLKLFNVTVTIVQRNRTSAVIGSKEDKAASETAPAPISITPSHQP